MTDSEYRKLIATRVYYEWVLEELDQHEEIVDLRFADSLADLLKEADGIPKHDLALVRNTYTEIDGITDRQYAYLAEGKLTEMEGGAHIPKRYLEEATNAFLQTAN